MRKTSAGLAACVLIVNVDVTHATARFTHASPSGMAAYQPLACETRPFGLDHSHSGEPEELLVRSNSIAASGAELFEIYAIHTEGSRFLAVVSAKMVPTENLFTTEREAEERANELQRNETMDNVQYAVRPAR
jgi:hypothetical protein